MTDELKIGEVAVAPGETRRIDLPVVRLYTDTEMAIPVHVHRGRKSGPCMFVCAAIHGDELNGIEIINRLINSRALNSLRGTLIAVPVVNVYGLLDQSRYLPDRRDLNRSFPGSPEVPWHRVWHTYLSTKSFPSVTTASTCTPVPCTAVTCPRSAPT
ncbi:succinylglutamate desuccinylase/aspartoacylase family protein [Microbulbifer rhizosphaerae]|uniref:Putative deacylase n=1 Tax=Microbulbifer rhizosphaerae TaxID=1562603 RepID=A0A7W4W9G9_9GAMM|nr:succinylglutamate desuccinylase/aspartoacylase family protein [Microbulbifer rhizosphaerae]MBB3060138.1 putative deacylase [Microbulbifer rhizosphaerae]